MSKIAIVDSGVANIRSLRNAIEYCGGDAVVTRDRAVIADASHVILPGVGAFGDGIASLRAGGLDEVLTHDVKDKGKPFLAICLGMQLLAETSTEHAGEDVAHRGLGWFKGQVIKITPRSRALKIPHMGWNTLETLRPHPVLAGIKPSNLNFYFVHSYWLHCANPNDIVASVRYDTALTAIVARDNIVACQFHPEKSQDSGLELIGNFLRWNP